MRDIFSPTLFMHSVIARLYFLRISNYNSVKSYNLNPPPFFFKAFKVLSEVLLVHEGIFLLTRPEKEKSIAVKYSARTFGKYCISENLLMSKFISAIHTGSVRRA